MLVVISRAITTSLKVECIIPKLIEAQKWNDKNGINPKEGKKQQNRQEK